MGQAKVMAIRPRCRWYPRSLTSERDTHGRHLLRTKVHLGSTAPVLEVTV